MYQGVFSFGSSRDSSYDLCHATTRMTAKHLGAYYTDSLIARSLVQWAVRDREDIVLDPCFGGGVFLSAAAERIVGLGGTSSTQVLGVEIDPTVHACVGRELQARSGIDLRSLRLDDFFCLDPGEFCADAVVGNPPFIRFHRFSGAAREAALGRAAQSGVKLSNLASSWAPFVVHAVSMVRPGGRLAMVVPAELAYASYARQVLVFIHRSFENVRLLSFRRKLFQDLSEDTLLLLAGGKGEPNSGFWLEDYDGIEDLCVSGHETKGFLARGPLDADSLSKSNHRIGEHFIEPRARELYHRLKGHPRVACLAQLADVGIGYVTGANEFFHLTPAQADELDLSESWRVRTVYRGRAFRGLDFQGSDWMEEAANGAAGVLLAIPPNHARLPKRLGEYLRAGEVRGVSNGFKCRSRSPWYSVPHVHIPDGFLTYMSGIGPKLVGNEARVSAPNTLHVVRMRASHGPRLRGILAGWQSSLCRLSMEIEGHAMGGGMLKLEPSEADRLLVPDLEEDMEAVCAEIDKLLRAGDVEAARRLSDEAILMDKLGLSKSECQMLSQAARDLSDRRMSKGMR